jgi:hypothetical protein
MFRSFEFWSLRLRLEGSTDLFRASIFEFRIYNIVIRRPVRCWNVCKSFLGRNPRSSVLPFIAFLRVNIQWQHSRTELRAGAMNHFILRGCNALSVISADLSAKGQSLDEGGREKSCASVVHSNKNFPLRPWSRFAGLWQTCRSK